MKKVLIFSGTTEGRTLAQRLSDSGICSEVCVATEYGTVVMGRMEGVTVHQGRMTVGEMKDLIHSGDYVAVVDATHPFATVVSENIKKSMTESILPYFRLKRDTKVVQKNANINKVDIKNVETEIMKKETCRNENIIHKEDLESASADITYYPNSEVCAHALRGVEGNILLTTGSKELSIYCREEEVRSRIYARVLPAMESISLCMENKLAGRQILAIQAPFSVAMNEAIINEYKIRCIVTKESGITGGFYEKLQAAQNTGIQLMVIGNPENTEGLTFEEVCEELEHLTGVKISSESTARVKLVITLIGMGPGNNELLTKEAYDALQEADLVFGARRLLDGLELKHSFVEKVPYYLSKDIIPYLRDKVLNPARMDENISVIKNVAIVFSGDTGFYSGTDKLYRDLVEEIEKKRIDGEIKICPGISSVSYFASRLGISWQDSKLISIHGRKANVIETVRTNRKTFLLVSGLQDMIGLGKLLIQQGMEDIELYVGYQLTYPEEEVKKLSPLECTELDLEGLYLCFLYNHNPIRKALTHGLSDHEFYRDKVPMTKEEVREVSICKLGLHKDAILYDIGSGTGSIAVECARLNDSIQVYAIERKIEALHLIEQNCMKFDLANIKLVEGEAPEVLEELPAPTHAFIGGSGGNLKEILELLYQKNSGMRVVINAITLETITEVTTLLSSLPVEKDEILQMQVSRAHKAGGYHLMKAENPVYIISFFFRTR